MKQSYTLLLSECCSVTKRTSKFQGKILQLLNPQNSSLCEELLEVADYYYCLLIITTSKK